VAILFLAGAAFSARAVEVGFKISDHKNAPVADAVVSLKPLDTHPKLSIPTEPLVIAQQKQQFVPYVTAVMAGTSVKFPNNDTVKHQVYSNSEAKKFELPLYFGDAKQAIVFDKAGVVAVGCNIHDTMIAYIVVLDTPYFAKSGADGVATIESAPPGHYLATVWQPRLGDQSPVTRDLTIADGPRSTIAFTLELERDKRIRRIPDSRGGGYK
jgi:plastocyanin